MPELCRREKCRGRREESGGRGWGRVRNSCQRGTTYALAGVFCVPASAQFHRLFFARRRTKNYLSVVVSISLSGFHDNEYSKRENRNRIVREYPCWIQILEQTFGHLASQRSRSQLKSSGIHTILEIWKGTVDPIEWMILPNIDAEEYADVDLAPRKQFDFIHIRYQSSGICDGPRIFRLAFE
ncbi:hypothetical protein Q9L58_005938 [Maublancomyces gigas]|uniref:Uncharacterized protein n=1 Tax=Discina gigas TaxID=1032678 RepID=A0ABR3GGR4_9PEZI